MIKKVGLTLAVFTFGLIGVLTVDGNTSYKTNNSISKETVDATATETAVIHPNPWSIKSQVAVIHPNPWSVKSQVAVIHPNPWSVKSQVAVIHPNPWSVKSQVAVIHPNPWSKA
ncbi:hypothetical protein [Planococcus salinarum]|uniref:hypothetical protein n=1 Tax=Planococcus salinarum TaxID=622695 RepID=UPI00115CDF4D|nr:hypothetical protein [Planococcus salinarum]